MSSLRLTFVAFLFTFTSLTVAQTLTGVIDMHAHAGPDGTPRSIDAIDLARLAKSRGMRGFVLKNHYEPTAALAWIVRKEVPGIEVFGGISLDLTVGGVNPAAVDWMTKVQGGYGRVVWMPTFDSESQVKLTGAKRPFAAVSRNGVLLPEVIRVISIIARNQLVLETGHSSPTESLLLIAEARRQGVQNIVVTHALANPGGSMYIPELTEAAKRGAYIELIYSKIDADLAQDAAAIRAVGAASCILSSDLGQPANPLHPDGLLAFYRGLAARGISEADIVRMSSVNPAHLLGLKP